MYVKQNCETGLKDLNCQGGTKRWLDPCMRIFEDNDDFVVRKRATISFNYELKFQGFMKCREKEINDKLKTDIFSSDIDCMRSKMEFMQIRKGLAREKREKRIIMITGIRLNKTQRFEKKCYFTDKQYIQTVIDTRVTHID